MASTDEKVNFVADFELRGERQVERGLESITRAIISAKDASDVAAVAVQKFGRIFEVGVPIAIAASAVGELGKEFLEMTEHAKKAREAIEDISKVNIDNTSIKGIEQDISKMQEMFQAQEKRGFLEKILFGDSSANEIKHQIEELTEAASKAKARKIDESSSNEMLALIDPAAAHSGEKISQMEERIRELTESGQWRRNAKGELERREHRETYKTHIGSRTATASRLVEEPNANQPEIDATRRAIEAQRGIQSHADEKEWAEIKKRMAKESEEADNQMIEAINDFKSSVKNTAERVNNFQMSSSMRDSSGLPGMYEQRDRLKLALLEEETDKPAHTRISATHLASIGGGGRVVGGTPYSKHVDEIKRNTKALEALTIKISNAEGNPYLGGRMAMTTELF